MGRVAHILARSITRVGLVLAVDALWVPHFSWGSRSGFGRGRYRTLLIGRIGVSAPECNL